jgi:hypothetical protein
MLGAQPSIPVVTIEGDTACFHCAQALCLASSIRRSLRPSWLAVRSRATPLPRTQTETADRIRGLRNYRAVKLIFKTGVNPTEFASRDARARAKP